MNTAIETDMEFTKTEFPEGIHMCLIYDRDEDREKVVSEFMAAGFKHGEQVCYFTDTTAPEVIRSWLLRAGVDIPEARESGSFIIIKAENSYYPEGRFDPQETINGLIPRLKLTKEAGY